MFLQTFCCVAGNKDKRDIRMEVRGLLDPGSDRSFLLRRIASVLRLTRTNTAHLSCSSFLQGKAQAVSMDEVMVSLHNHNDYIRTYRMYVTPCITGEICTAPSPDQVQQVLPSHLIYADPDLFTTNRRPIEMLLGNDVYHEIVNVTRSRQIRKGFVLLSSFFGWIPSGNVKNRTTVMGNAFGVKAANPTSQVGIPDSSSQVVLMQSSMLAQEELTSTQPGVA